MSRVKVACPSTCERLSELVTEARLNYPDIHERQDEPGFRGSCEEADLIHAYIDSIDPAYAPAFTRWRQQRAKLPGISSGGVDLTTRYHHLAAHRSGVLVLS